MTVILVLAQNIPQQDSIDLRICCFQNQQLPNFSCFLQLSADIIQMQLQQGDQERVSPSWLGILVKIVALNVSLLSLQEQSLGRILAKLAIGSTF